jgi:hypothetical protein
MPRSVPTGLEADVSDSRTEFFGEEKTLCPIRSSNDDTSIIDTVV